MIDVPSGTVTPTPSISSVTVGAASTFGVPRSMYAPYPFQIIESTDYVIMVFQFANALRTVYMTDHKPAPAESWMGWSNGHWEGDTLVVEVTGNNDQTWFDRAGNFHSEDMKVTERYSRPSMNYLMVQIAVDDPKVLEKPWNSAPHRWTLGNGEVYEFYCTNNKELQELEKLREQELKGK